jgi:hypothetical protein
MPAVVSNQSSRSGLITAVIVSVTLAVVMIVVAVYYGQSASKAETALANRIAEDRQLYSEGAAGDPRVTKLMSSPTKPEGLTSALDIALAENDQLARLVGTGAGDADKANTQAKQALTDAAKTIGDLNSQKLITFNLPPNAGLTTVVQSMSAYIAQLAQDKKGSDDQLASERKSKQDLIASDKAALDAKDKDVADANTKAAAAQTQVAELQNTIQSSMTDVTKTGTEKLTEAQATSTQLASQLQVTNKKLAAAETLINSMKLKLKQERVNPNEAVVQQPDGTILRIADSNTVYISIGSRQSVTKGLTFEVYDKGKGIPPLGNGTSDSNMPVGKASIEVYDVGPDSSACRVIKLGTGEQLVVGDLISNLVFDPNTRYNFVVYGDFDLSGSGVVPSPSDTVGNSDTQVIKRLITQWGGKLQDHIDVNTDFVVMGIEPEVPTLDDPSNAALAVKVQAAKQRQAKYQSQITEADRLNVPIMNQNRFLYFIGYYDQAKR